jgi:general secretion pathway protein L
VLALDALSAALPDDTWLSELRLAEGRLRMTGISHNVAGLVPMIEGSPGFTDATFFAPTTRLPGSQGDRFHLEARLVPAEGPKP